MATITELARGQIATQAGADKLRGELLSAHTVRSGDEWTAVATIYSDGAAEIEVAAGYDRASNSWRWREYYYSFEKATQALVAYEDAGRLPAESDL
jgi:hypothetical protein